MTQHVCFSSPRKIHDSKSSFVIMKNQNVQRIPICHKVHTTFYCDFLLQTLYPYSSSFKLFFSVRKLSGKFHKSSVCLCALRGDFSPFFLLWRYRRRRGGPGRGKYIGAKAGEAWQARTYYVGSANVSNL